MPFAGILEILEPFSRGVARHPEEALLHFGSRIFNMAMSYPHISGDHLADHRIYLSLPSPSPRPLPLLPPRCSCATHFCCCPRVAIPPSIAVAAVLSIAIAITAAVAPSIAITAVPLPSLHVLQMLLRHQSPSRCRCVAVVPTITSAFAITVAPSIAVHQQCRCVAVAFVAAAAAVAIAVTTTAHFC